MKKRIYLIYVLCLMITSFPVYSQSLYERYLMGHWENKGNKSFTLDFTENSVILNKGSQYDIPSIYFSRSSEANIFVEREIVFDDFLHTIYTRTNKKIQFFLYLREDNYIGIKIVEPGKEGVVIIEGGSFQYLLPSKYSYNKNYNNSILLGTEIPLNIEFSDMQFGNFIFGDIDIPHLYYEMGKEYDFNIRYEAQTDEEIVARSIRNDYTLNEDCIGEVAYDKKVYKAFCKEVFINEQKISFKVSPIRFSYDISLGRLDFKNLYGFGFPLALEAYMEKGKTKYISSDFSKDFKTGYACILSGEYEIEYMNNATISFDNGDVTYTMNDEIVDVGKYKQEGSYITITTNFKTRELNATFFVNELRNGEIKLLNRSSDCFRLLMSVYNFSYNMLGNGTTTIYKLR